MQLCFDTRVREGEFSTRQIPPPGMRLARWTLSTIQLWCEDDEGMAFMEAWAELNIERFAAISGL